MNAPDNCPKCGAGIAPAGEDGYYGKRNHFRCGKSITEENHVAIDCLLDQVDQLTEQRDQLAATLEAQRRGAAKAERLLCEALGVESGADVLDAISGLRERVKRLEEAGDFMELCLAGHEPFRTGAKLRWAKAKEAQP